MENKQVEKSLNNIREGIFSEDDTNGIGLYIEQLEQEIRSASGAIRHACSIVVERENNVKQLEQEIKELNACIDRNEKSHLFFTDNQVKIIKQLKQEDKDLSDCIRNLEKQLELKNKALDNACHFIQEIHKTPDWGGIPQCEKCGYLNSPGVCWDCEGNLKKMFEKVGSLSDE